jgi:hypothetical protein
MGEWDDRSIDAVARQMTSAVPAPHLRARVLERLEARRPVRWAWVLAPAAATVAVAAIAATLMMRGTPGSPPVVSPAAAPRTALAVAGATRPGDVPTVLPVVVRGPARARVAPAVREQTWNEEAVPALPRPAPLTLIDIQPNLLSIPQLDVKPIVTEPLTVPSIDGRPGGR